MKKFVATTLFAMGILLGGGATGVHATLLDYNTNVAVNEVKEIVEKPRFLISRNITEENITLLEEQFQCLSEKVLDNWEDMQLLLDIAVYKNLPELNIKFYATLEGLLFQYVQYMHDTEKKNIECVLDSKGDYWNGLFRFK